MKHIFLALFLFTAVVVFAQNDDFHLDKEYAISPNGTIDLSSSDADVIITGTSRQGTARVKIDRTVTTKGWYTARGSFKVDVDSENGNLRIREQQSGSNVVFMGYIKEVYKIQIEAPEGVTLNIKGDDGDYFIKNIDGTISMNFDDGDAQLTGCDGNDFRFRIDDGDLKMDQAKGSIDVIADDADIEILNASFTNLRARLDDGDFIVHTTLTNNGNYQIDSEDGLVMFGVLSGGGEINIHHDDSHISSQASFKTVEDTERYTKLMVGNGTARVTIHADDGSVKLVSK